MFSADGPRSSSLIMLMWLSITSVLHPSKGMVEFTVTLCGSFICTCALRLQNTKFLMMDFGDYTMLKEWMCVIIGAWLIVHIMFCGMGMLLLVVDVLLYIIYTWCIMWTWNVQMKTNAQPVKVCLICGPVSFCDIHLALKGLYHRRVCLQMNGVCQGD